jgi:hypothetical protein
LTAIPAMPDLRINNTQFRHFFRYFAGISQYSATRPCSVCSRAGAISGVEGDHELSCTGGKRLVKRHDAVRNALGKEARDAGFDVKIEEVGLIANTEERPADVLISNWEYGMDFCIDVTVINPLAEAYYNNSVNDPLHAVMAAEEWKMVQSRLANLGFLPFGMTSLGAFTATSTKIMSRLAAGKAAVTLLDLKEAKGRIYTNIQIAMIRAIGFSFSLRV